MTPIRNTDELPTALSELAARKGRKLQPLTPRPTEAAEQQNDDHATVRLQRTGVWSWLYVGADEHPTHVPTVTAYAVAKILVARMADDLRTTARLSVTGQLAESEIVKRLTRRERVATSEIEQWFQDNRGR